MVFDDNKPTGPAFIEDKEKNASPYDSKTTTRAPSPSTPPEPVHDEKPDMTRGRVCGGSYLENLQGNESSDAGDGPLTKVDIDMPLTLTRVVEKNGKKFTVLRFVKGDTENPFNWSPAKKAFIAGLLCSMTLFIGLATSAYSSGVDSMVKDLGVSTEIGQLGMFCFNFTCALAPLFLAPFCELVGRRVIYVGAYACFILMFLGLALGKNIATILVSRALSGLFGCVGTILVGGTFSDMYRPNERAVPMATFAYVAILGTIAAPIYCGFIDETIGWRWIEGIQGLSNIPLFIACIFFLRETRGGVTLQKRAKMLRKATGDDSYLAEIDLDTSSVKEMLHESSVKAIHMLVTEPVVLAFGFFIAFAWAITFLFLSVIPITFAEKRGWSEGVAGLPYISLAIGTTIGFGANFLQIRKYNQIRADPNRELTPEARLYGAMFGTIWLPIGLFIYSFTQYAELPWIAPTIALTPIAVGIFFIFESCYSFTSDCYGESSGSAIAGQGLMRNTLGAVTPLFASQFFHNVGSQYAGLILALIAAVLSLIPFVLFKYGPAIRARSKMAITMKADDNI